MWTADSTQITADQTCWTADGYNGCEGGASEEYKPEEALEPQLIEEDFIIDAHYRALKLAIYAYYGIEEELH